MKFIKENLLTVITSATLFVVGMLLLINPVTFAVVLIRITGALLIVWGAFDFFRYFRTSPEEAAKGSNFYSGMTLSAVGIFCLFGADWFIKVFPVLAVLYGLFEIFVSFRLFQRMMDSMRQKRPLWYFKGITAGVTFIFGMIIVCNPEMTMINVWVFTGVTMMIEGILNAVTAIILSKPKEQS